MKRKVPFLFFLAMAFFISAAPSKSRSNRNPAATRKPALMPRLSVDEIDARVGQVQGEIAEIQSRLRQLVLDSGKTSTEQTRVISSQSARIAELEGALARESQELSGLKEKREKARQDSLALWSRHKEKTSALNAEVTRLESAIAAAAGELRSLASRRQEVLKSDGSAAEKAMESMQRDAARRDSLIRADQEALVRLKQEIDKARRDSAAQAQKEDGEHRRCYAEARRLDSLIYLNGLALSGLTQKKNQAKQEGSTVLSREKTRLDAFTAQQIQISTALTKLKSDFAGMQFERERLRKISDGAQREYDQARTPFAVAATSLDEQVQRRSSGKDVLVLLREKLKLDSSLVKARKELDGLIEASARGDKNSKRLVDEKEKEVTKLAGQLDLFTRKPGVRDHEVLLTGHTMALKRRQLDSMIAVLDREISELVVQREKAQQDLAAFEAANPLSRDPSLQRIKLLDGTTAAKEQEIAALTLRLDSIDKQTEAIQKVIDQSGRASQRSVTSLDSLIVVETAEKNALSSQRAQVRKDSSATEASITANSRRWRTDISALVTRQAALEREIPVHTTERDRILQSAADAKERNRQARLAAEQEKKRLDSLIAGKESEKSALARQSEKTKQDSIAELSAYQQSFQQQQPAWAKLETGLRAAEAGKTALSQSRDSLMRQRSITEKAAAEQIAALQRDRARAQAEYDGRQADLAGLKMQRADAVARLHRERERIDSLLAAGEQSISDHTARRDKARQDSVAEETARRQSAQASTGKIRRQDSALTASQRQSTALAGEVEAARSDSLALMSKHASSIVPFGSAIRRLDSLIGVKERELADLRGQKENARQDSVAERKRQAEAIRASREEILRRMGLVEQKRKEGAALLSERTRIQQDSAALQTRHATALLSSKNEIDRQAVLLESRRGEVEDLRSRLQAATAEIRAAEGYTAPPVPPPPAAPPARKAESAPKPRPGVVAQQYLERIYGLLGEGKNDDASALFGGNQVLLQQNLDAEAYHVLKTTMDQLAPDKNKKKKKK